MSDQVQHEANIQFQEGLKSRIRELESSRDSLQVQLEKEREEHSEAIYQARKDIYCQAGKIDRLSRREADLRAEVEKYKVNAAMCQLTPDMPKDEMDRRIAAFHHPDHSNIYLTLNGYRFVYAPDYKKPFDTPTADGSS